MAREYSMARIRAGGDGAVRSANDGSGVVVTVEGLARTRGNFLSQGHAKPTRASPPTRLPPAKPDSQTTLKPFAVMIRYLVPTNQHFLSCIPADTPCSSMRYIIVAARDCATRCTRKAFHSALP